MHWNNKVIWSEGMFLQPQHFQQHDRYIESLIEGRIKPLASYDWGFTTLEIDNAALSLGKVQITSAKGILPDGTPFEFPNKDVIPEPFDVPAGLKNELIVLALPIRRAGTDEIEANQQNLQSLARYSVAETEIEDANVASENSALIQVGDLRLKLMRKQDLSDAYCSIGVTRVIERRADNQLMLDQAYIPSMLAIKGNKKLGGYAEELQGLIYQRCKALAARVSQPGRGGVAEIADFLFLQTVNRHAPLFTHLVRHSLLHPERLFSACLMLAGDLAIFSQSNRQASVPPEYKHDDLEISFTPLMTEIRQGLGTVLEQSAIPIELRDVKYGVRQAIIPDAALLKAAIFILAVNAQVSPETLRSRFPTQVKIGPAEKIRDLVNLQLPGIPLRSLPVAPRQLPYHAGFNYFELEQGGDLWKQLEKSGGMAMHVAGNFPGLEMEFWAIRS